MSDLVHPVHAPTAHTGEIVTDAEYRALESVRTGSEVAARAVQHVKQLNRLIGHCDCSPGCTYRDPALLKIKETLVAEFREAIKRAMRTGSGTTEETITRQQRYYQ